MDEQVQRLAKHLWEKLQDTPKSKRRLIAISGIPGSGKTTLAAKVTTQLNKKWRGDSPALASDPGIATFVPMDGFHLTRAQLSAMPDPNTAHKRRGAAFTFDSDAYFELVKKLRQPLVPELRTIYAPSFDHSVKDPVADDIPIAPSSRIVLLEGNYLALNKGKWKESAELMDELWFVEASTETARKRLIRRHVESGVAANEEEAVKRVDESDLLNAKEIIEGRLEVNEMIPSIEDPKWAPENQVIDKERDGL
ncbi:P-loop containing nucleoside triphosphate hydrolase protein [Piedraia hortae CBS 480.64]|uniref:P-loop containing nucleoside triphosphate hydrolase protein n=1 Tax=Piedraia hortae CBS 480.64 TaxID=1314780 RepID=A0A6A7BSL3_9PEZI|nr:P-loop containing nucleoside triphosphate hydrolase protein [Piedraia hortae CBS 480.64]